MKKFLFILMIPVACRAGDGDSSRLVSEKIYKKSINIYVISKDKYFDLTNRIIVWQAKLAAFFHHKLKIVMAYSTDDAEKKIAALLNGHPYRIETLWLDSHGKYRKGYSSFMIGNDEYSYHNIADTSKMRALKKIASYCDPSARIGIGACYAAADFDFPVYRNGKLENMHGDSLIKGIGRIFRDNTVYACKSWVMAKLWIFGSPHALSGFPLDKQYKDTIFLPVWHSMGEWHAYTTQSQRIEKVNTVYLSKEGDILMQDGNYSDQKKAARKLARNLKKLKPGLYDLLKQ